HKQYAAEWGIATPNNSFSNYASLIFDMDEFAYGPYGAAPASLGRRDVPPNYSSLPGSVANPVTGGSGPGSGITSTIPDQGLVYYSPQRQGSNDFVDNMIWKFGYNKQQQLQFFMQSQLVNQILDYGVPEGSPYAPYGYAGATCKPTDGCAFAPEFASFPNT